MSALVALVALPAAALVTWLGLRSRLARRLVARPTRDRWHESETPSLGGVGIFAGLLAGAGVAVAVGALDPTWELFGILAGCAVVFAVGLADDLRPLPPVAKVGAQLAAALIVLASGVWVEIVKNDAVALLLGAVWLVGMTNAFNLLDNMDGLAGSLAAIACGYFAIDAVTADPSRLVLVLSLSLGCACAGFLPFNLRLRRPAAVFMGDSGSQVLGFALAALGLATSWKGAGTTVATLLLPILILAVPILDTTLVTLVRLLEGRPIYAGGRDHTSHRLVSRGLSEKRAVVLLAVIAAALGATSLAYNVLDNAGITLVGVLVTFALLVQFASFLAESERAPAATPHRSGLFGTFVVHRRRLLEVLVDFALITASFSTAYLLRFGGSDTEYERDIFMVSLPVILASRYAVFLVFGLYSSVWRYAGARDAVGIVAAVALSEVIAVGFLFMTALPGFGLFSRSVFVIDALLCMVLIGASRFGERGLLHLLGRLKDPRDRRRILIVGAGRGGRSLVRELHETPGEQVVGFVDDDPSLRRRRIHGVPVLGSAAEMERVLEQARPTTVLVTIPDAPRERLDFVVAGCANAGVPCRFVRRETNLDPDAVLGASRE